MEPSKYLLLTFLLLVLPVAVVRGQATNYEFRGIPVTVQELDLGFDIQGKWTGQLDLQTVTQGASLGVNNNPLAYWNRFHIRPWLQYRKSRDTMLATSVSYLKRYAIPPLGYERGDEVRVSLMGNFTQRKAWGSLYQQVRGEVKNNKSDGATDWTHTPRFRFRFGQNFHLKEGYKHAFMVYQEVMVKYKEHSKAFDILRFHSAYSYTKNPKWAFSVGLLVQFQLNKDNKTLDTFFGPTFGVRYQFGKSKHPQPPPDTDID